MNEKAVKTWARIALIGIAVYVVLDIVVELLTPHYSVRQAESVLAIAGPFGFIMNINFLVRGVLSIAGVVAISLYVKKIASGSVGFAIGRALLLVWGVAALFLALFNCDDVSPAVTVHGKIHVLLGAVAFVGAPIGAFLMSLAMRKIDRLRTIWAATLVVAVASAVAFLMLLLKRFSSVAGIVERVGIALILVWIGVVASRLVRVTAVTPEQSSHE